MEHFQIPTPSFHGIKMYDVFVVVDSLVLQILNLAMIRNYRQSSM